MPVYPDDHTAVFGIMSLDGPGKSLIAEFIAFTLKPQVKFCAWGVAGSRRNLKTLATVA